MIKIEPIVFPVIEIFKRQMVQCAFWYLELFPFYIPVRLHTDSAESTHWEANLWSYAQMQTENVDLPGLQMTET
jgi:hypothetical protein